MGQLRPPDERGGLTPQMEGDTVRLRTWLPALLMVAGVAVILCSPVGAAETKPAVYTFGTLKAPTVDAARAQAQAWLQTAGQSDQKAFEAIWGQDNRSVLDRVTETLVLGNAEAAKALADA